MSKIALTPNANGSGVFTLASPNSNTNRTITLPDESVTLGAGTPSIDDNGNATAITIDSSENVLIGTTNANIYSTTTTGINLNPDGATSFNRNGGQAAMFNRINSDGEIVQFRKNGTTVGSIGIQGTGFYIDGEAEHAGIRFGGSAVVPRHNNADSNNYINLGDSSNRFKDAYLSGGIYLGGTAAANKLDDYEEGLYTVSVATSGGSITLNSTNNKYSYVKVGKLVTVTGRIDVSSVSSPSGPLYLSLPFAASTGVKYESAISLFIWNATSSAPETGLWIGWVTSGSPQIQIRYGNSHAPSANVANYIQASTEFRISVSYETDA